MAPRNRVDPKARKRAAAAEYIAVESSRLSRMADANKFPFLAYLLDMVVLEAWREAEENGGVAPSRTTPSKPRSKAAAG
jgi:hypothetical protein